MSRCGEKKVRAGEGLLMAYASANRDAQHWGPTAEQFDITRADASGHVGFGVGEHFCMGAALRVVKPGSSSPR